MATREKHTPNAKHTVFGFWWCDLATIDVAAAKKFYGPLLGWDFEDLPIGDGATYTFNKLDDLQVGAMSTMRADEQKAGIPPHWNTYLTVDDVDARTAKVESLGGKVLAEPFDVMDVGRMSVIADPSGAPLCLWETGRKHPGAQLVNVPGAMVWNELNTTDVPKAKTFFDKLLDGKWSLETDTTGAMEYTSIKYAGTEDWVGGLMELPEQARAMGAPSNWVVYFAVEDCDATVTKATELGAQVYAPAFDVPGTGRMAVLGDPQGAAFAVIQMEQHG
jgi:predicted enzyme related to lactoylglutathione lyase